MSVSIRNILGVVALTALGGAAYAGGCCGGGGGATTIPVVNPPGGGAGGGCCGPVTSHPIGVPGVYVPAPKISVAVGGAQVGGVNVAVGGPTLIGGNTTLIGGGGGGDVFIGGGGGGFLPPLPPSPGLIENLNTVGGKEMETVQETRTVTETLAIRAVCLDDRGMPHPASRTDDTEQLAPTFNGEIFRCMAGTRMEVTLGRMVDGRPVFDGGQALSCQKGQALTYANGQLTCSAQIAKADCHERSLLRRYGPGLKYATVTRTETYTAQREVVGSFQSNMFISGGVGQGLY